MCDSPCSQSLEANLDASPCDTPQLHEELHKHCPAAAPHKTPTGIAREEKSRPLLHVPICQNLRNQNLYCKKFHDHNQDAAFLHHHQWQQRSSLSCTLPKSGGFLFLWTSFSPFFFFKFHYLSAHKRILKEYFIMYCIERLRLPFASTLLECRNISIHQLLNCIILSVGRAKSRICQWMSISTELHPYVWNVGSTEFQLRH